ncbi:class I tRNA ligase family protein, partial [candidate division KSB1 bacterium]|nr:class I tRNA ligase family protein [candidate division KSB1 bacterium]
RIPVYYCLDCDHTMVRREHPAICEKCQSDRIKQDEDVLDTWFSSWLWPFSTMDWPQDTPELKYFYPTSTLVTAPEIIFFWVARMIMAGMEFMGEIPFHTVYFNGLIRDAQGRKMSKSLGNGIDPLEMVNKYSADAVRLSLMMLSAEGQDINLSESSFEIGRNFSNKLWNAFRFLGMNLENDSIDIAYTESFYQQQSTFDLSDRWILSRYHKLVEHVTDCLEKFRLNEAMDNLYRFFWHEYCDWYLELIKPRLYGADPQAKKMALGIGLFVMRGIVKLLHPFIPFITEEIWQHIKKSDEADLIVAQWPQFSEQFFNDEAEKQMQVLQQIIGAIRNIRGEMNVPPNKKATLIVKSTNSKIILDNEVHIKSLAQVETIEAGAHLTKPRFSASAVVKNMEIFIPLEGLIDIDVEKNRLEKEINRLEKQIDATEKKLSNKDFQNKAPKEVFERERQKNEDFRATLEKLKVNISSLINKE